ncbi:MAG: ABC transporter permease [Candidatus Limnocylindrales bacterium]
MTAQPEALRPAGRKRKNVRSTRDGGQGTGRTPAAASSPTTSALANERPLRGGWRVIAAKEFADQVTSVRFLILTIVLSLAAAAAVYSTAGALRDVASQASGAPSLFLVIFTTRIGDIPAFTTFIGFLGPLLGIAFGFDGINGERSEGTLPRLLAQPIHRDDVINGKFVAGLAAIGVILAAVTGIVAAIGVIQLGIVPDAEDVLRVMIWFVLALAYIGLWLAFALLCSVLLRRAATSALTALAAWLVLSAFFGLLVGLAAGVLAPVPSDAATGSRESLANAAMQVNLRRLAPNQLFSEATAVILDPSARTVSPDLVTPAQLDLAIGGLLSLEQSLLVVWGQFVALIAATIGVFALAYVAFMRQEVRA